MHVDPTKNENKKQKKSKWCKQNQSDKEKNYVKWQIDKHKKNVFFQKAKTKNFCLIFINV